MEPDFATDSFVESYVTAFEAADSRAVAAFYAVPCLTIRADGSVHAFSDQAEVEAFFAKVLATYRAEGMSRFAASDRLGEAMGHAAFRLTCTWSMARANGSVIRDWRQTYVFQRLGADWRIAASIFHIR